MTPKYTYANLPWRRTEDGRDVAVIVLAEGDSAWNPTCTTCLLWGPSKITYTRWPDGGVDALEEDAVTEINLKTLTTPQLKMLIRLRQGAMNFSEMTPEFGRQWRKVWAALRNRGLVEFKDSARDAKCYTSCPLVLKED
jgi:hypothetical protein